MPLFNQNTGAIREGAWSRFRPVLLTAILLTLFVLPVIYDIFEREEEEY